MQSCCVTSLYSLRSVLRTVRTRYHYQMKLRFFPPPESNQGLRLRLAGQGNKVHQVPEPNCWPTVLLHSTAPDADADADDNALSFLCIRTIIITEVPLPAFTCLPSFCNVQRLTGSSLDLSCLSYLSGTREIVTTPSDWL